MTIRVLLVGLFLSAFSFKALADSTGMDRVLDGSSEEALQKSMEMLPFELTMSQISEFSKAYIKLTFSYILKNNSDENAAENALQLLDGKTPREIIALAEANAESQASPTKLANEESNAQHHKEEDDSETIQQLSKAFAIDGVEVIIDSPRFGELSAPDRMFATIPSGEFLLLEVSLKNITDNKIIQIQDAWKDVTLTDNFGNIYDSPYGGMFTMYEAAQGMIKSQELRPGEAAKDLIVITSPLETASDFELVVDPNFWRPIAKSKLQQLSNEQFKLVFKKSDIQ